jgi:hypothetical protein
MAAENIGSLYNTKIPGYEDAADIQAALKLFLYGSSAYDVNNTDVSQLPNPSLARHLNDLQVGINTLDELGTGSVISSTEPNASSLPLNGSIPNGFIWVDSSQSANNSVGYLTAVYTNDAPTTNLVDGVIWVDKNSSPLRAYVYNASTTSWDVLNELEYLVDNAGDMVYGSGDNQYAKLALGATGQILKAGETSPYWGNEKRWVSTASGTLTGSSLSIPSVHGERLAIVLKGWSHDDIAEDSIISLQFNEDESNNYIDADGSTVGISLDSGLVENTSSANHLIFIDLAETTAGLKPVYTLSGVSEFGYYASNLPIESIQVFLSNGEFDSGTYEVWSYR